MQRLFSNLDSIFNPVSNPIIVKELRSRMRGPRAFITLTSVLIFMAFISYALYQLVILTSSWSYTPLSPQVGQTLFTALAVLEMMLICLITPAVTAGAISSEHENLTLEMLLSTPLKPTRILWGKLVSALSYIFLLVFAAIPIGSLVFVYGGVAPQEMLKALVVLVCTAIMLGTISIFMSTWLKRSGRATIASYFIVLGLLGAPSFLYAILAIIRQAEPPRWLLVLSPINALFSAIAPSTSLSNSSLSMLGGVSMLMGGNLGTIISTDSIPRPLYHYTLPLYGLITLVLYFFATILIRPTRRWKFKAEEVGIGLISFLVFLGAVILAFGGSANRYENSNIFSMPTPFIPFPVEPRAMVLDDNLSGMPLSDEEATGAYASVIRETFNQDFIPDTSVIAISQQTYFDPSNPEESQENSKLHDEVQEGVPRLLKDLPFEIIWQDDFSEIQPEEEVGALLILGNLEPLKLDFLQVIINVNLPGDQPNQTLTYNAIYRNGQWNAQLKDTSDQQNAYSATSKNNVEKTPLSFDEIASIYTTAILQAYTVDTPIPGADVSKIYLMQSTDLAADSIILPPEVQNRITDSLEKMTFAINWVENQEMFLANFTDPDAVIITFGSIVPHNDDGSVEVMIDIFYNEENRVLVTYILHRIDGEWQITDFGGMG